LETVPHVTVFEATNGQEALVIASAVRPNAVLMDVQMPVMDGMEATRLIKEQQPTTRVVILTMHAQHRQQALAAGADHFLLKGSPPEIVLAAVFRGLRPL
jgi:CheY-like chemotaxis protein